MFVLWSTCLLHPCIGFTTHFLTVTITSSQLIIHWGGRKALCPLGFTIRYNSNYALILFLIPPITFIGFKPSACVLQVLINLYMTFLTVIWPSCIPTTLLAAIFTYGWLFIGGIDEQLAQHFAHLFIRDPISLFQEKVGSYDDTDMDHFENIQSTNWQTMR